MRTMHTKATHRRGRRMSGELGAVSRQVTAHCAIDLKRPANRRNSTIRAFFAATSFAKLAAQASISVISPNCKRRRTGLWRSEVNSNYR
jgi:hypothetical protein